MSKYQQRTIAVVTGSRADFGLLEPVMRAVDGHPRLTLRVVVAGWHLAAGTRRDVTSAGFEIAARVRMQERGRMGRAADVAALSRGIGGFGRAFEELRPNVAIVLGDRIEAFAAASAASIGGTRVAHIHGGDRAEGVADEAMRHAISKLAHVHFAATGQSRRRLIRMGEPAETVFHVGSPAADGLRNVTPAADAPEVIVLQHPVGASAADEQRWMGQTLAATRNINRLVMSPNGDSGSEGIRAAIREAGISSVDHLPRRRWLEMLAGAKVIAGNSSAGLIEAAVLRTACVNIGPRQAGRERPGNVIDCDYGKEPVQAALEQAVESDLRRMRHPYGNGRTGEHIAEKLAELDLKAIPLRKHNSY